MQKQVRLIKGLLDDIGSIYLFCGQMPYQRLNSKWIKKILQNLAWCLLCKLNTTKWINNFDPYKENIWNILIYSLDTETSAAWICVAYERLWKAPQMSRKIFLMLINYMRLGICHTLASINTKVHTNIQKDLWYRNVLKYLYVTYTNMAKTLQNIKC